jgi:hypothetical protein
MPRCMQAGVPQGSVLYTCLYVTERKAGYVLRKVQRGSMQKSYKIMKTKISAIIDKVKPDIGNTRGLNLAAVMFATVQVSRLPLWRELLVNSRA